MKENVDKKFARELSKALHDQEVELLAEKNHAVERQKILLKEHYERIIKERNILEEERKKDIERLMSYYNNFIQISSLLIICT